MTARHTLVLLVAAACAALVYCLLQELPAPAAATKVLASTAFLVLAWKAGALATTYGRFILAGLCLSWFGDVFLIGNSQIAFLAGLVAFLLAHVSYVSAFVAHGYQRSWVFAAAVPLSLIAIAVWFWLQPHTPAHLAVPVRAYILVISIMVVFAIGTRGRGGSLLIVAGAILFFLSDLSVAALRLLQTDYPTYVIGLPFYYAGQVCLALSVSQSRSH